MFWARDYSMATRLIMLAQTDAQQALTLAQEEKQKSSRSNKDSPPILSVHRPLEELRLTNGDIFFQGLERRNGPQAP